MSGVELAACPFCGDPMTNNKGVVQHVEQGRCVIGAISFDESDADRWNRRAVPMEAVACVRYARSHGETLKEMRAAIRQHPLYQLGDAVLCWVNEGDLYMGAAREVQALAVIPAPGNKEDGR